MNALSLPPGTSSATVPTAFFIKDYCSCALHRLADGNETTLQIGWFNYVVKLDHGRFGRAIKVYQRNSLIEDINPLAYVRNLQRLAGHQHILQRSKVVRVRI